jgi:hypothetical protein
MAVKIAIVQTPGVTDTTKHSIQVKYFWFRLGAYPSGAL